MVRQHVREPEMNGSAGCVSRGSVLDDPSIALWADEARVVEGGVVDDHTCPAMGSAPRKVKRLGRDVPSHAGVARVGIRAVAGCHPLSRDVERHIEEDREVPDVGQFIAVKEEPVDDHNASDGREDFVGKEDLVAREIMPTWTVSTRTARAKRVENVGA